MVFGFFSRKKQATSSSVVPTLYPGLDPLQLERFLADQDYERIKRFENAYILPFARQKSSATDLSFGLGLSRLMIRNLMLLHGVSIHGPEDTSEVSYETVHLMVRAQPRSVFVTGVASMEPAGYSILIEVRRPGRPVESARVSQKNFKTFLHDCSSTIARLLGCEADDRVVKAWNVGQPRDANSLIQLGEIHLEFERAQMAERGRAAERLFNADPDFAVAVWDIDEELPTARAAFFRGLERDPFNAQLCFSTFCNVWTSQGPQPEALQFCRKAIELSPGHGKAHMCAPHAAQRPVEMLRHSELGYRLLPGNSFAVNNYTIALARANAPIARLVELAEEGIAMDPRDPGNYERLIELCLSEADVKTALATAEQLQRLYEPKMDERALYCLRQNPHHAKLIDSGAYNPAAVNRSRIAELRERLRNGGN